MKCLMKYQWVKLPRNHLPEGKGIMNAWAKLASRAAFRKGQASYCGHINAVSPVSYTHLSVLDGPAGMEKRENSFFAI